MPLIRKTVGEDGSRLGLWKANESIAALRAGLNLTATQEEKLASFTHERRKQEWLAVRQAFKELVGYPIEIAYDEYGVPQAIGHSFQLSISHSHGLVAVITHPSQPCGLDVEQCNEKIGRIARKFVNEKEKEYCELTDVDRLHVIWGAKESLFKWYGKGGVDFREHLYIYPFAVESSGTIQADYQFKHFQRRMTLVYEKVDDYFLVFVLNN